MVPPTLIIVFFLTVFFSATWSSGYGFDNSEHVIHVWNSSRPQFNGHSKCVHNVTLNELITSNCQDKICKQSKFIIHQGIYFVTMSTNNDDSKSKKSVTIEGEPGANISCEGSVSFFISRIFAKAKNTNIHNLHFENCAEIELEFNIGDPLIHITNSTFVNSSLYFKFSKETGNKFSEIKVSNIDVQNCNTNEFLQISRTSTVRRDIKVTVQNLSMSESLVPLYKSQIPEVEIVFEGQINFHSNRNFTLYVEDSSVHFTEAQVNFSYTTVNIGSNGAPIYAKNSSVTFEESKVVFMRNTGTLCGGIRASDNTKIIFKDNVHISFLNNSGSRGGALSLYTNSRVVFNATMVGVNVNFTENRARISGGAIYVEDSGYGDVKSVFDLQGDSKLVKLLFMNNSALFGGHQIHGGWIDFTSEQNQVDDILVFNGDNYSYIASDPIRVCLCDDNHVANCSISETDMELQGCSLNLAIVAVGQRFTPVLAYVEADSKVNESNEINHLIVSPRIQSLQKSCSNVKYKISPENNNIILVLKPNPRYELPPQENSTSAYESLFTDLTIHLKKRDCILGFVKKKDDCECVCLPSLKSIGIDCSTSEFNLKTIIVKNAQQWVGVTKAHITAGMNNGPEVISHEDCPLNYCEQNPNKSLTFPLEDQDQQCAFDRSGILCGGCKTNFSRVLGSIKCKKCANDLLLLKIFSFMFAGVILVVVLTTLDLTISVGTINGLIFYANVIQIQRAIFFHSADNTSKFLSTFIAWLNLDLGIESCFFDGLDSYVETWLQFCFPLYIWMIVFAIIITSRYSSRVSKLCGRNIVQVLATLLLLSYTKLLSQAVDVITFREITYHLNGHIKAVWAYDGNIDYLRGKHVPLFLTTVLLQTVLAVVFPLCLVSIQCLQKISHLRGMFWINRLKPFFDAYTGPCKASHRYWPGFLLIMRISVLLIVTINHHKSTVILLALTIISFVMLAYFGAVRGIYNNWIPNCLEILFLCNLGVTSAVHCYVNAEYSSVPITISVAFAFKFFIGILLYHALQQILRTKLGARLKNRAANIINKKRNERLTSISLQGLSMPTTNSTVVELKEPLIE